MKRILLANFHESPENLHFELALIRAVRKVKGLALDILHDFDSDYGFIGESVAPGGKRVKYSGLESLGRACRAGCGLMVLLDFPKRDRCAPAFIRLARELPAGKKIFVANHLIPMPGQNLTADLARKLKALSGVDAGFMLEADDRRLWSEMGLSGARLLTRGYASDCAYYSPVKAPPGDYVFSAGSAGRNFGALAAGAKRAGLGLRVFSDSKPKKLPAGIEFLPLSKNLSNLKAAAASSRAVVVPVTDSYLNESAGNSIVFLGMALGRPVLTKRTPYMKRFIQDGKNGFFYTCLSPASIAEGLRRITALSPAGLKKLGAAARRTILQKASLDRFCHQFLTRFVKKIL